MRDTLDAAATKLSKAEDALAQADKNSKAHVQSVSMLEAALTAAKKAAADALCDGEAAKAGEAKLTLALQAAQEEAQLQATAAERSSEEMREAILARQKAVEALQISRGQERS